MTIPYKSNFEAGEKIINHFKSIANLDDETSNEFINFVDKKINGFNGKADLYNLIVNYNLYRDNVSFNTDEFLKDMFGVYYLGSGYALIAAIQVYGSNDDTSV
jgi:hypothetical protein